MTGKTHQVTALATSLVLSDFIVEPKHKMMFIVGSVITAKLPDIDLKIGIRHRGHTHSIVGVLLFSLILIPFGMDALTTGFIWGYIVHILADSFTVHGIYPFYPCERYRLRLGKIRTGTVDEEGFVVILVVLVIIYYYLKLKVV